MLVYEVRITWTLLWALQDRPTVRRGYNGGFGTVHTTGNRNQACTTMFAEPLPAAEPRQLAISHGLLAINNVMIMPCCSGALSTREVPFAFPSPDGWTRE